jgi:hypothetical protein
MNMNIEQVSEVIDGYTAWIQDRLDRHWKVYFLTFQFHHLGMHERVTVMTMQREVERFYRTLLTRLIRRPARTSQQKRLPLLIGVPDSPVAKHQRTAPLADIWPNLGIHFHAILGIAKKTRVKCKLSRHIKRHQSVYLGRDGKLAKIHVRRVRRLEGRVVDYLFKHIKRRTFTLDDVLILPRSAGEPRHA